MDAGFAELVDRKARDAGLNDYQLSAAWSMGRSAARASHHRR
jgi:hypothetical protein